MARRIALCLYKAAIDSLRSDVFCRGLPEQYWSDEFNPAKWHKSAAKYLSLCEYWRTAYINA